MQRLAWRPSCLGQCQPQDENEQKSDQAEIEIEVAGLQQAQFAGYRVDRADSGLKQQRSEYWRHVVLESEPSYEISPGVGFPFCDRGKP